MSQNCFGQALVLTGQKRFPNPPAIITQYEFLFISSYKFKIKFHLIVVEISNKSVNNFYFYDKI